MSSATRIRRDSLPRSMLDVSVLWSTPRTSAAFITPLSRTSSLSSAMSLMWCMSSTLRLFSKTTFPVFIVRLLSQIRSWPVCSM